jgi:hypothetical protein
MDEVLCGVCNTELKKYKCPSCALPSYATHNIPYYTH